MRAPLLATLLLAGCATTQPRFEQDVATTFAQDSMRHLVTDDVEVYYPAEYADAAKQVAARASECLQALRRHAVSKVPPGRALLFLTSANYNNAYVGGQALGEPLHSVVPLSVTTELFHWYGLGGAETGDIACHEMFHYAHYEQVRGFWRVVNDVLGPSIPPQAFLERWFTEGVAQYYEGRLGRRVGRPFSPLYRGSFDSFVAMRGGEVQPGDLQLNQRELYPYSGAYLTGLHFVEWLAARYGEEKLWAVIHRQGRDLFAPFGAALRLRSEFGLSTGALVEAWSQELKASLVVRTRPPGERVIVDDLGQFARLAAHGPSGTLAVVSSGNEQVPLLRILEADGRERARQRLARLGTDREWVSVSPVGMSGLSFTADGRYLYLLNDDLIERGDTRAQLWKIDAQTAEVVQVWQDLGRGMGGSVSADGRTFTFVELPPSGRARIVERDLGTGAQAVLLDFPPGVAVSSPAWNGAHTQLTYARLDAAGWNLVLWAPGDATRDLTSDGAFNYGARWADDTHLVFARTAGKYLQAHRLDLSTGALERLTDTPWGLIDPFPAGTGVAAIVRDGVHWSLDVMPGAAQELVVAPAPEPSAERPAAPALAITRDEAYAPTDHLFLPQLRVPSGGLGFDLRDGLAVSTGNVGLSLIGRDRLGRHNWALYGWVEFPTFNNLVQLGYRNLQLAPWALVLNGQRSQGLDQVYWNGTLAASRTFFSVPVSLGVQAEVLQTAGLPTERYWGPALSLSYAAGDGTPYGGPQRTFSFSLDLAGYPRALGSDRDLLDVRGAVALAFPLPLSRRHSLQVSGTGRALQGAPASALAVGGTPSFNTLYSNNQRGPMTEAPTGLLPGTLVEGLRGYDDAVLRTRSAAIFGAEYRYRFIIDRGFASILWIFPSLFFRQVDVEAFGAAALTERQVARSVGAAVFFRVTLGGLLPLSLVYQFAWRFDLGLAPLHVVAFSFD